VKRAVKRASAVEPLKIAEESHGNQKPIVADFISSGSPNPSHDALNRSSIAENRIVPLEYNLFHKAATSKIVMNLPELADKRGCQAITEALRKMFFVSSGVRGG
jgi:hypothetical protein